MMSEPGWFFSLDRRENRAVWFASIDGRCSNDSWGGGMVDDLPGRMPACSVCSSAGCCGHIGLSSIQRIFRALFGLSRRSRTCSVSSLAVKTTTDDHGQGRHANDTADDDAGNRASAEASISGRNRGNTPRENNFGDPVFLVGNVHFAVGIRTLVVGSMEVGLCHAARPQLRISSEAQGHDICRAG